MPDVLAAIEATMSQARLARYFPAAKNDKNLALRLYVWNARLCEEFYIPLQFTEVGLRNAVNTRLLTLYGPTWFDENKFISRIPDRHKEEVKSVTTNERAKRGASFTQDHIVAGMSFGFWQNLMGRSMEHILWGGRSLHFALPYLPLGFTRDMVYKRIEQLRKFRNAIMHHYAIFDKNPTHEYLNIRTLLSWICPETLWLMSELSNPAAVLQKRPRF